MNNDNKNSWSKNSTGSKKNKDHLKKASIDEKIQKSESSRNMLRHKRISASENDNSTKIRNMSAPDLIEEYEVTERIPAETAGETSISKYGEKSYRLYSNEERLNIQNIPNKYSLTKKWKYYRELQLSKLNEQNNKILEQGKGSKNLNDVMQFLDKIKLKTIECLVIWFVFKRWLFPINYWRLSQKFLQK